MNKKPSKDDRMTQKWLIDMLDTMLIYTCATFDVNDEESKKKVRRAYTQLKEMIQQKTVTRGWVNDLIGLACLAGGTGDYKPLEKKLKKLSITVEE